MDRPWVIPDDVKEYSHIKAVKERSCDKIKIDIIRAEKYIMKYTNNDFSKYDTIPDDVKIAVILLAEKYGYNSAMVEKKGYASESYDEYSYSLNAEQFDINVNDLGLEALLDSYKILTDTSAIKMKMRRL